MDNELLTVKQLMARLQVSHETVYQLIRSGKIQAVKIGKLWRIRPSALSEFIEGGKQS